MKNQRPKNKDKSNKRKAFYLYWTVSVLLLSSVCLAEENKDNTQELGGFSLIQYDDVGGRKWKLNGKTAQIEDNTVVIDEVSALAFINDASLKLKAKEGSFDKDDQIVQLEKDVIVKTTDGTRLSTDSLSWNAGTKNMSTQAPVNIKKADFEVDGTGAVCDMNNQTAELKEDIKANMRAPEGAAHDLIGVVSDVIKDTVITCNGPLELNYKKNRAVFKNNVIVEDNRGRIYADRIDIYFNSSTKKIKCVVARGNVRIVSNGNTTYSDRAIYLVEQGRVILPKRPKLIIESK